MSCRLRVTFVMARTGWHPGGGHRIVYQYANHLSRLGHDVTVVTPARYVINPTPLDHIMNGIRYCQRKLDGRYTPERWLAMEPDVRLSCVPSLDERYLPDADVIVTTAWQTAELAADYSPSKGRRFYLIQHLETWNGPEDRVYATWKAPLQKIVVAKWLYEIAESLGESALYIPNGLDVESFEITTPPEQRRPQDLMMLYHKAEWKGSKDGIEALSLVREQRPGIKVNLFGVPDRPKTLPDWIEYHQTPSPSQLRDLYNQAAIFVAPSRTEGWGLPACEAMLSGAALVATDVDGHREFAIDEETAFDKPGRIAKSPRRQYYSPHR